MLIAISIRPGSLDGGVMQFNIVDVRKRAEETFPPNEQTESVVFTKPEPMIRTGVSPRTGPRLGRTLRTTTSEAKWK
eukprot:2538975-Rhodomonas_salina.1